ncbi:homeodomain-like protein [Tanacetum coccineum]
MPFDEGELHVKYPEVPLISTRLLNRDYKILVERVLNWIGDWKNKSLSFDVPNKADMSWGGESSFRLGSVLDSSFGVNLVMEALRPRIIDVPWHQLVWFLHCIPHHAFNLWLVMRNSLKTHDQLWQWDVGVNNDLLLLRCTFCDMQPDSISHLFFKCGFSSQIWLSIRPLAGMENVLPRLHDIVLHLQPLAHKRSAKSVIGRLLVVAASYFIWIERNNCIFKKVKMSPEDLSDTIMVTITLKLLTFRFKNTRVVNELLSKWSMPSNFRLYV